MPAPPDPLADATDLARHGLPQETLDAVEARVAGSVTAGLASGSAWALGYLRGRYDLPLASWDDAVVAHVCYWVAAQLLTTLGAHPDNPADAAILARAKAAEAWFLAVAAGTISPDIVDAEPDDEDAEGAGGAFVVTDTKRGW